MYRFHLFPLIIVYKILHASRGHVYVWVPGSVKWPLSYKYNLLDVDLFPWEYTIINYKQKSPY